MKKTICVILSLIIVLLCLAGCSKAQTKMSFDEFVEKYFPFFSSALTKILQADFLDFFPGLHYNNDAMMLSRKKQTNKTD